MLKQLFKYFCSLLLMIPFSILFLLESPIYVFRFLVSKIIIRCYPKVDKILTTRSSLFASDAIYKNPKCSLVAGLVIEGTLYLDRFREVYQTRVIDPKTRSGQFKKPEWQQHVTRLFGFQFWKWEDNFDIQKHVGMYEGKYQNDFLNGAKPLNMDTLVDVVNELTYLPFQPKMSPWKVYLIHNYRAANPLIGEATGPVCTVMVLHWHHCLGDGFSMRKALQNDLADIQEASSQVTVVARPKPKSRGPIGQIATAVNFVLSAPYDLLVGGISAIDSNSWHIPEEDLRFNWNCAVSQAIPIEQIKEVKNLYKVTLTTLILECFAAAIRKFMMEAGFIVPDIIHCATPLPAPGHPDKLRNYMTGCFVSLPVGISNSKKRMLEIEKHLAEIKKSTIPIALFKTMVLSGGLFRRMIRMFFRNTVTTAGMSNIPGPAKPLILDGHKVVDMAFGTGLQNGNCGMGFTSIGYNGMMRVGVGIDEGIVPQSKLPAKKLIQYFLDHMDILRKEAVV